MKKKLSLGILGLALSVSSVYAQLSPVFNFSEASTSVSENVGSVSVSVTQGLVQACDVSVVKTGGTAPVNNFTFMSPTQLSFNGTATSQTITIPITNNTLLDGNRTIILSLQTATNGCTIGATAQITITITDDELPPVNGTTLYPGDIAIVAVNAADPAPNDRISFVNLVEIAQGTEILFTDNGYERGNAANVATNTWGNAEGVIKFTYAGTTPLPAGTINEFTNDVFNGPLNTAPVNWTRSQVVPLVGTTSGNFNMSTTRDQLFVMQGVWNNGTFTGTAGNNDATFTGNILFGYSNADWALLSQTVANSNADLLSSRLPSQISCINFASVAIANSFKTTPNSLRVGNKIQICNNLKNIDNWQPSYTTQTPFTITGSGSSSYSITTSGSTDICAGSSVTLSAPPDFVGFGYLWSNGETTSSIVVTSTGNYSFQIPCLSVFSDSVVVTVNALPMAMISQNGNVLSAMEVPNASYQWLLGGQPIANATSANYTATVDGNYTVRVTLNGCSATSDVISVVVISIANKLNAVVKLYPNPSTGIVNLEVSDLVKEQMTYSVTNALGQEVISGNISEEKMSLSLPQGFFFVKIQSREGMLVKQIVVQ